MRKIPFTLLPILLSLFLLSCHGHRPVTTIKTNDGNNFIEIKYNGTVSFSADSSFLEGVSPMSMLRYRNNSDYLMVKSNEQGQLSFEMTENGKTLMMDQEGKAFLAKAVKVMMTQGAGVSR